jgi:hypothetical protein
VSTSVSVTVWCDHEGCLEWVAADWHTTAEARREAKGLGWSRASGQDLCVAHSLSESQQLALIHWLERFEDYKAGKNVGYDPQDLKDTKPTMTALHRKGLIGHIYGGSRTSSTTYHAAVTEEGVAVATRLCREEKRTEREEIEHER